MGARREGEGGGFKEAEGVERTARGNWGNKAAVVNGQDNGLWHAWGEWAHVRVVGETICVRRFV